MRLSPPSPHGIIHDVLRGILLARHLQEHDDIAGFHFRRSEIRSSGSEAHIRTSLVMLERDDELRVNRRGLIADRIRDESVEPYHRDLAHVARVLYRDVNTIINSLRNHVRNCVANKR